MTTLSPEDMTLEEIKEQLALYNRLYYQKRRLDKDFMETKRASAIRYNKRKKVRQNGRKWRNKFERIIDYEAKDPTTRQDTKPTKYKNINLRF